ncbi:MAG: sigma-70 family RNA polymerase sigma factor [Candidatus Eisenbacteria bacterium]|uniref:Sigma-70 family RNA polymerase sigma factor n=1 Tax=Eiseniibacteriota bacterium TaxID=2212470 RepID=A0A956M1D8_UNCEI|nr:sigma-70 family RNA polymerase sigma factor [Candidatus Eisenbacteria bacterium]
MTDDTPQPHLDAETGADALMAELYTELRKLARARMAFGAAGPTLQPTALVHEVYLRLSSDRSGPWQNRAHFFGAAAIAMRRILVEQARRKRSAKRGGGQANLDLDEIDVALETPEVDVLALDRALQQLQEDDPRKATIVSLRFFAGLEREEIADLLGVSVRTVDREWKYCVARLHRDLQADADESSDPPRSTPRAGQGEAHDD